jgi:hypothetical protein
MFADAGFGFSAYSPPGYSPAFTHPDFSSTFTASQPTAAAPGLMSPLPLLPTAQEDAIYAHLVCIFPLPHLTSMLAWLQ